MSETMVLPGQLPKGTWRLGQPPVERGAETVVRDRARHLARAAYTEASVAGDLRRAEALLAAARQAAPGLPAPPEVAMAASFVLLYTDGDVVAAHRRLARVIGSTDRAGSDLATIGEIVRLLTLVCHYGGRADLWESLDRHVASFGPDLPASLRLFSAVVADPARSQQAALDRLDAAIESLAQRADATEIARIAGTATFVDRLPDCRQALRRVVRTEPEGSAGTPVMYAQTLLSLEAYLTGQWDEAGRLADAAEQSCQARGYQLLRWNARAVKTFLAAARGDAARAQELADEMTCWAAPRGVRHLRAGARYACVLAAMAQADFEGAYHHATAISPAGQLAVHQPYALWVMLDLVEAALRTGRASEAAAHVRAMQAAGVARISPRLAMVATAAAAMIAPDAAAVELFGQAMTVRDAERWPFDLARVQLLCGERLRRAHGLVESRAHLGAAFEAFRRLGARTWAERAAIELRATGQSRLQGRPCGPEALTPQELQIAMLAATGLTNKQIGSRLFLSHRTVGAHLYKTFPKLGITARAALRDALPPLDQAVLVVLRS